MTEEIRNCRVTGEPFVVFDREKEVLQRLGYPLPDTSPLLRHQRRFAYRNERKLHKNRCHFTGVSLISVYAADSGLKAVSSAAWWGSDWDPRDYGREVDFSRPFFPQLLELKRDCPRLALLNTQGENSDYCNNTIGNKNCYLVFGGDFNQDCLYSIFSFKSRDVCDVYWIDNGELVYDCINVYDCYNLRYSQECSGCRDSAFLYECRNCEECCCSVGLVSRKFCIFNQQYSEADYRRITGEMALDSYSGVERTRSKFSEFCRIQPRRAANIINCENVSGDNLTNSRNCLDCYDITGPAEDLYHIYLAGYGVKDLISCSTCGHDGELYVECMGCVGGSNYGFSTYAWSSTDILYSDLVTNCRNLFGCTNMKRTEFCILNRQYTESQYFELKDRLIAHMKKTGEWGQFPPIQHSVFPYNSTVAQDNFPMTKEQALKIGCRWQDEETRDPAAAEEIPESINAVDDSILQKTLVCRHTGRPYRIIPKELAFYRRLGIPLPRHAPETRNEIRLKRRKTLVQSDRVCAKCGVGVKTVWDIESAQSVLCHSCYLQSTYS